MDITARTLTPAVLAALTYWPALVGGADPEPPDLGVLLPVFNELLGEFPWWSGAWRVTQVDPATLHESASKQDRSVNRFTEVSVPGTLSGDAGQTLPFVARVRFEDDQLRRFQAKIGDTIIGPARQEAGAPERHPFGAQLTNLMDSRGISVSGLAKRTFRAQSTINGIRTGRHNPHPVLVRESAHALDIPETDLAAMAGVDDPL